MTEVTFQAEAADMKLPNYFTPTRTGLGYLRHFCGLYHRRPSSETVVST